MAPVFPWKNPVKAIAKPSVEPGTPGYEYRSRGNPGNIIYLRLLG
jgi:hypothetical protein